MPFITSQEYKSLPRNLSIPEGNLVILTGPNNSGKSAILQYLNIHSELRNKADYISPRRFDLSNEVAIALNNDVEMTNLFNERKRVNPALAEFTAPDPIKELIALPDKDRELIIKWHNDFFGKLSVERSNQNNEYSPPRITIDGRLATQQGSGSRAVLSVLCALLHPNREIVLIDEPEIGLEPYVQKRLAQLIREISRGDNGLPKKRIYIATHSHLFLDKENILNNWIVKKGEDNISQLIQVKSNKELQDLTFHLLGNSPSDLYFPDNILIVEGASEEIFFKKIMLLREIKGIAIHIADGSGNTQTAINAIDQMLKTQAYISLYRNCLCVIVDQDVKEKYLTEWRNFLNDDNTRVRKLSQPGIEWYYPQSILADIIGVRLADLPQQINTFLNHFKMGNRKGKIGSFEGSKVDLSKEVVKRMISNHLTEVDSEIQDMLNIVDASRFSSLQYAYA